MYVLSTFPWVTAQLRVRFVTLQMGRPKGSSFRIQELVLRTIDLEGSMHFNKVMPSTGCNRNAVSSSLKLLAEIGAVERRQAGMKVIYETGRDGILRWLIYTLWERDPRIIKLCKLIKRTMHRYQGLGGLAEGLAKLAQRYDKVLREYALLSLKLLDALMVAEDKHLADYGQRMLKRGGWHNYPNDARRLKESSEVVLIRSI